MSKVLNLSFWFFAVTNANLCFAEDALFGFGRNASNEEVTEADIDVRFDGSGLPEGEGTFAEGRLTY
ncbi:MAG: hypothetical protein AAF387_21725, partial [Pseudomonadota bacterium]